MPRIISYNVNGIRAALKKGLLDWIAASAPDVLCLQEVKAFPDQFDTSLFEKAGYHTYWHPAQKKGYSGVAILTKEKPDRVVEGCGIDHIDAEGRILRADFGNTSLITVYIPSGSSGELRQNYKMQWLREFRDYLHQLSDERKDLIICGDYNICHKAEDIHNPVANAGSSGFLPEEREWLEDFMTSLGFVDGFRHFNKDPHHYSWWSYRAGARRKNLGWRIDYTMVRESIADRMTKAAILKNAYHSDHCPVLLDISKF